MENQELPLTSTPTRFITFTPSPNPTSTDSPIITPTFWSVDPTDIARATQKSYLEEFCLGTWNGYMYNTNWGICDFDDQTFVVFNTNGLKWDFSYLDLGIGTPEVINIYHTSPVHWANDGTLVYLSTRPDGYDPLGPFLGTGIALLKLDLTNGEVTTILPNVNRFYSISISPSGKYLVYSLFVEPIQVNIVDTQSGESSTVFSTEEYDQVGEYVWSDDDTRLVYKYIITGDECFRIYSINTLSLTNYENETIIKDTEVNTCQPSDPTFYIEGVTDLAVKLKQSDDIWIYEIGSQKMRIFSESTPQP